MEALFIRLFNISITAGWLILAVVVLRFLHKKAPKWISCLSWAMVGIRLMFPFSIESIFSLIPSTETVPQNVLTSSQPEINSGIAVLNQTVNPIISQSIVNTSASRANPVRSAVGLVSYIWIIGMVALLFYAILSYIRLRTGLRMAVRLKGNIWQCENVDSPFVLGLIRPRIYIPYNMEKENQECVIAHEWAHIERKDHWIKPLGFLLLTVYWFNPLVWLAYILLCKDMELACDERVIKNMDTQKRKIYLSALLTCSTRRKAIAACPIAFGETGVKQRIKGVLNYKKPGFYVMIAALFSCLAVGMCFLTDPKADNPDELDKAVSEAIVASYGGIPSDYVAEAHTTLKVKKHGSQVTVYAIAMYEGFNFIGDEMEQTSAGHNPAAITFEEKENGEYQLAEYWIPRDGEYYVSSIRSKFPRSIASRAIDDLRYMNKHKKICYEKAKAAKENFNYCDYTPYEMVYLGSWYDVTSDYFLDRAMHEQYTISEKQFKIVNTDSQEIYENPQYASEPVGNFIRVMGNMTISTSNYVEKKCYKVMSSRGEDTGYRLYYMDHELWLSHWGWYGENKDALWCEYIMKMNKQR